MINTRSTTLCNTSLTSCLMNASGCLCTTEEELKQLDSSDSGAVVSKSSTVLPRTGNPEPRFSFIKNSGTVNSMGVPNLGFDFYKEFRHKINKPYVQSIMPFSKEDLVHMLQSLNDKSIVELNLSCPNIDGKTVVAYDYEQFESYLDLIKNSYTDISIGVKLPPYYENNQFDKVANIIKKNDKIKFVTCINSVVNGLCVNVDKECVLIKPKDGFGGIGGLHCKPTALANVRQFYNRLNNSCTDVVGCGGVSTGEDAFEHILCGASAVQIGSALMLEGPDIFKRVNDELISLMKKKKYKSVSEFKGALKTL